MPESTTIRVRVDTWRELHSRKGPGDSMDDVIQRLLADDTDHAAEPTPEPARDDAPRRDETPQHTESAVYTAADLRADLTNPGSAHIIEERVGAVVAAVEYLREHGEASKAELQDALYESHSAGYEDAGSWWKNCIMQAFAGLRGRGVVELTKPSRGIYTSVN